MPWKSDLNDSAFDFQRVVWPRLATACGGGRLVPVETVLRDGAFERELDMLAGIDAWQVHEHHGIRGIASRVQWGSSDWQTFTIRKARDSGADTEFAKRLAAIQSPGGWLWPHLTIQAYVMPPAREGALISCAAARTADIIALIQAGRCCVRRTHNASFYVVEWKALGPQVRIVSAREQAA